MKPLGKSNNWFRGALILTVAAFVTKILSAVYRVPFQNMVGDIGFYIYQQVYPFYGFSLVLSTYGFPVIISKYFAEMRERNELEKGFRFLLQSFIFLSLFGIVSFLLLYFGSEWLAIKMEDPQLAILFKVISLVFLVFPSISVLRGYFQGMDNMMPTAISQVGEQSFRVLTILLVAGLLLSEGFSLYEIGAGAAFGSVIGGLLAIFILVFFMLKEIGNGLNLLVLWNKAIFIDLSKVIKLLFIQGIAVCISGMLFIFMQMADSLNMLSLLVDSKIEVEAAKVLKGVYDRGQPLIQMGTIAATSMSLSLVPLISSARMKGDNRIVADKIQIALKLSVVIGVAATVGLLAIIQPTNIMLFENQEGSEVLALLTPVIFLSSIMLTLISILQGLGVMFFPAVIILFSFALKYGLNIYMIPKFGPSGAALASNISILLGLIVLWLKMHKLIGKSLLSKSLLGKVLLAAMVMFFLLKGYLITTDYLMPFLPSDRLLAVIQAVGGVMIGGVAFLFTILRTNVFQIVDLALLPFGSKLMVFVSKEKRS